MTFRRHAQHDTVAMRKNAVDATVWYDFKPGQRVNTIDGILGTVEAVYDGPVAGNEEYDVTLDNGLGGGQYTASQLTAATQTTAVEQHEAGGMHTAAEDYPELGSILVDRPDPGRQNG